MVARADETEEKRGGRSGLAIGPGKMVTVSRADGATCTGIADVVAIKDDMALLCFKGDDSPIMVSLV